MTEMRVYEFSPADGMTPFRHAVRGSEVFFPTWDGKGWRTLTPYERARWEEGIAYCSPRFLGPPACQP